MNTTIARAIDPHGHTLQEQTFRGVDDLDDWADAWIRHHGADHVDVYDKTDDMLYLGRFISYWSDTLGRDRTEFRRSDESRGRDQAWLHAIFG